MPLQTTISASSIQKLFKVRLTRHLTFQPKKDNQNGQWKGDGCIDAAEYQPVNSTTDRNFNIPPLVRVVFDKLP